MKISVVTISFNQARYLHQCIESVLSQDGVDFEYIVVDPGSTDGSREIIESYGDRLVKIFESDNGPSDGLNRGFSLATGDIFYFINSDDFVLPNSFARITQLFAADTDLDVVLAGGLRVNEIGESQFSFYPSNVSAKSYVNGAVTLFQQGMFFKSELFRSVGGFNIENKSCWDGELLLSFILKGARFTRIMEKVAAFRFYPESITGSQRFADRFKVDHRRMFEMVYGSNRVPNQFSVMYYRAKKLLGDPVYLYKRLLQR